MVTLFVAAPKVIIIINHRAITQVNAEERWKEIKKEEKTFPSLCLVENEMHL